MLANYVALAEGVPLRLHFTDDYMVDKDIRDPDTGKTKRVKSLVFFCDTVGGEPSAKTFSVISSQLAALMEPYLKDKNYRNWDFIITKTGTGFLSRFQVQAVPRPFTS